MAQLATDRDRKPRRPELCDPADKEILQRMKYFSGDGQGRDWNRLNWYVELGKKDLNLLSPGQRITLQEEFRALRATVDSRDAPTPSLDEIKSFAGVVQQQLIELADRGETKLGPFQVTVTILDHNKRGCQDDEVFKSEEVIRDLEVRHDLSQSKQILLYHFACLLEQWGGAVHRCPHCRSIFLQFRKSARYCNRKCQSVAAMRRTREVTRNRKGRVRKRS